MISSQNPILLNNMAIRDFVWVNIYHLVTPRFNEGLNAIPLPTSNFFSEHPHQNAYKPSKY